MTTTVSYQSTLSPLYATDHLDASKIKYVDVDGVKTRYYEDGDGPPLVLFSDGQIGSIYTIDSYSLNFDELAKRFRVIGMDKLGQGGTGGPLTDDDFTWEATVKHAKRFIEIMGLTGVYIGGHSRGGMLVTSLAYELPGIVKAIVIIDSGTLAPPDPDLADGNFYAALPQVAGPSLAQVRVEPEAQAFKQEQVTGAFLARLLAIVETPEFQALDARCKAGGTAKFLASLASAHAAILERIAAEGIPVPTLMLWDYNDKSAPFRWGPRLLDIIAAKTPWTEMHVFNQGGHYTFRENPEQFNRVVTGFCLQVEARSA